MFRHSLLIVKPYVAAIVVAKDGALKGFVSLMIDGGTGADGSDFDFVIDIISYFEVRLKFDAV